MRWFAALLVVMLAACAEIPPPLVERIEPRLTDRAMIAADGAELPLRRWLPAGEPRAVIAALHGFNDYSAFFDLPAPSLTAAGIAIYAYDQRGFGRAPAVGYWPGEAALRSDLYGFLRLLAARHPGKPLFVLGESMGAAVALTALSHPAIDRADLPPLSGVILVAPAVWSRDQMPWYQDAALWIGARLLPWMTVSGRGLHIQASDNIEMLRRMSRDPLVIKETRISTIEGLCDLMDAASLAPGRIDLPGLLLLGAHDEVVPNEASQAMLARKSRFLQPRLYPEGYHMLLRDLHAEQPLNDIKSWIASRGERS
jgi:alpha-beta hydrolase superfamily lysophospholipase